MVGTFFQKGWQWYKGLYQGRRWYVKIGAVIASLVVAFLLYLIMVDINFLWLFGKSPSMSDVKNTHPAEASQIYSADGKVIGKFFSENRMPVDYDDVSPKFWEALIDTEDERFYRIVMPVVLPPSPSSWPRTSSVSARNIQQDYWAISLA